jgi:hypothetical protein
MKVNKESRITFQQIRARIASACAIVLICAMSVAGCQKTPQLGNEECLGAADALWTAITAKDQSLVDQSEQVLKQLHAESKLTAEALDHLQEVIATARGGDWDGARGDLKSFVRGQRPPQG